MLIIVLLLCLQLLALPGQPACHRQQWSCHHCCQPLIRQHCLLLNTQKQVLQLLLPVCWFSVYLTAMCFFESSSCSSLPSSRLAMLLLLLLLLLLAMLLPALPLRLRLMALTHPIILLSAVR
jgi:hypothetical protein